MRTAERLRSVRRRLSEEVRAGRVRVAPAVDDAEEGDDNALYINMRSALSFRTTNDTVIWCDDRFINGHANGSHLPIVGVASVLLRLVQSGALDVERYASSLCTMRQQGFDFFLPSAEEIYASLRDDWGPANAEPERLVAMRRAFDRFSVCQKDVFGPLSQQTIDERGAAFDQYLLASRVVHLILSQTLGSEQKDLNAIIWVFENLRIDWRVGVPEVARREICEFWHASIILSFLSQAALVSEERRVEYSNILATIFSKLIKPAIDIHLGGYDSFVERISDAIVTHLEKAMSIDASGLDKHTAFSIVSNFLEVCPREIEESLCREPNIRAALEVMSGIEIDGLFFVHDDLWTAVDEIINTGKPVERSDEKGRLVVFSRTDKWYIGADVDGEKRPELVNPIIGAASKQERRAALDRYMNRIRLCKTEQSSWRRRFGQARTSSRRADLNHQLSQTPEGRLYELHRLQKGDSFSLDEIAINNVREFWSWLAGDAKIESKPPIGFNSVAEIHGMEEAIVRWSSLPVEFPNEAQRWFADLSERDANSVSNRLGTACHDPIARRNLLQLFSTNAGASEAASILDKYIAQETSEARTAQLVLAQALSLWAYARIDHDTPLSAVWISAWAWSGRLMSKLITISANFVKIADAFEESASSSRLMLRASLLGHDVLDPSSLHCSQFHSGLAGRWLEFGGDACEDTARDRIAEELTDAQGSGVLRADVLRVCTVPNSCDSWLGNHPMWISEALPPFDNWTDSILRDRDEFFSEVFEQPRLNLSQLFLAGVGDLRADEIRRILRETKDRLPHTSQAGMMWLASLIATLSPTTQTLKKDVIEVFKSVVWKMMQGTPPPASAISEVHFVLELGVRFMVKIKPSDVSAFEDLFLFFANVVWPEHRDTVARFMRVVADTFPIADRSVLHEIAAKTAGSPFPIR